MQLNLSENGMIPPRQPNPVPAPALLAVCLCLLLSACGDYPQGYQDGLAGNPQRHWLVFGRSAYQSGYNEGSTSSFFNWVDSNSDYQSDGRMCIYQPGFLQSRLQELRSRE